jgi:hypothetical protein
MCLFPVSFAFYCSPESLQNALLFNTLVQDLYHESGDRKLSLVSFHFKMYILACLMGNSRSQMSKFSMTSFYVTSFFCLSVRATLTIVKVQILYICMSQRNLSI